jgi:hypothetical protein
LERQARYVHIDKTMAEGHICDECGKAQKSVVVED